MKTIVEKIERIINDDFDKKLETISKTCGIPLEQLKEITDSKKIETPEICKGKMGNGKPCWAKCQQNGFCKRHADQYINYRPSIRKEITNKHNGHSGPFSSDCPECIRKQKEIKEIREEELLI